MKFREPNQHYQYQKRKAEKQMRISIDGDIEITIHYDAIVKYMGASALANRNGKCIRGYVEVKAINRKIKTEILS